MAYVLSECIAWNSDKRVSLFFALDDAKPFRNTWRHSIDPCVYKCQVIFRYFQHRIVAIYVSDDKLKKEYMNPMYGMALLWMPSVSIKRSKIVFTLENSWVASSDLTKYGDWLQCSICFL